MELQIDKDRIIREDRGVECQIDGGGQRNKQITGLASLDLTF